MSSPHEDDARTPNGGWGPGILASDDSRAEMYAEAAPKPGHPDYNIHAILFNDIGRAPTRRGGGVMFSQRKAIADYLFAQGWRREMRPDDVVR